jgi:AraC-like DNA-binding protein
MFSEAVSNAARVFVQQCQIALGTCADDDYVAQVSALWTCLDRFPRGGDELDVVVAATAACRVAAGFFAASKSDRLQPRRRASRRAHISFLLRLAQERHADPQLTLGRLARQMNFSAEFLSRSLAAETHHPFRTHVNGIRLLAAIVLLKERSLRVSSIAARVGYVSTGELDRQFNRWFDINPRRFRQLLTLVPVDRFTA